MTVSSEIPTDGGEQLRLLWSPDQSRASPRIGPFTPRAGAQPLTLLVELHVTLEVDTETVPLVLSLIDQLYDTRRTLRALTAAIEAQPEPVLRAVLDAAQRHYRDEDG